MTSPTTEPLMIACIIGAPGSGKGTLSGMLASTNVPLYHLSVGDYMRALVREEEAATAGAGDDIDIPTVRKYLQEGELLPTTLIMELLKKKIEHESGDKAGQFTRFLIDGFPRSMEQAREFELQVQSFDLVISLTCPREKASRRFLTRSLPGRQDDDEEMFDRRYYQFVRDNETILEYFRARGKVIEIDSSGETEETWAKLVEALSKNEVWTKMMA